MRDDQFYFDLFIIFSCCFFFTLLFYFITFLLVFGSDNKSWWMPATPLHMATISASPFMLPKKISFSTHHLCVAKYFGTIAALVSLLLLLLLLPFNIAPCLSLFIFSVVGNTTQQQYNNVNNNIVHTTYCTCCTYLSVDYLFLFYFFFIFVFYCIRFK